MVVGGEDRRERERQEDSHSTDSRGNYLAIVTGQLSTTYRTVKVGD